jgi:hypothetical protein
MSYRCRGCLIWLQFAVLSRGLRSRNGPQTGETKATSGKKMNIIVGHPAVELPCLREETGYRQKPLAESLSRKFWGAQVEVLRISVFFSLSIN